MQLDWYPLFCLFFIFHFIHLQNVKMFTCTDNVFRMFCFLCFNFAVFYHHDSPHRLPRPLARSSPPLCLWAPWPPCTEWGAFALCGWPGQLFPSLSSCCRLRETLHEVFAGSSISCLHQVQNVFIVDGRGESTHIPPNPSSQLPPAGHRWLDRDRKALVVLADRGFCRLWRL